MTIRDDERFMEWLRGRWGVRAVELAGEMLVPWMVEEDEVVRRKAWQAAKRMVEELQEAVHVGRC